MSRVIIGIFLVPLFASYAFAHEFLLIAYPFVLVATLLIAVPIFLVCRRLAWLNWWHAVLVGLMCSVPGLYLNLADNPVRTEIYGPMLTVWFAAMGAAGGLLFWWLALFRNKSFPTVPQQFPWRMAVLIPIAALTWFSYVKVEPFVVRARLQMTGGPPQSSMVAKSTAKMVLPSGAIVTAMLLDESPIPVTRHVCANMIGRASFMSDVPEYWVEYFMDEHFENYDKC